MVVDDVTIGPAEAILWHNASEDKLVDKKANYTMYTAPYVHYTVTVNPGALDLDKASDTLELKDTLGSALDFEMGSLQIDGKTWTNYKYDRDKKVLTITCPDAKAMTLTYKATVNLTIDTDFNANNAINKINLTGSSSNQTESQNTLTGKVLRSSGVSTAEGKTMVVYKHLNTDETKPIGGVTPLRNAYLRQPSQQRILGKHRKVVLATIKSMNWWKKPPQRGMMWTPPPITLSLKVTIIKITPNK